MRSPHGVPYSSRSATSYLSHFSSLGFCFCFHKMLVLLFLGYSIKSWNTFVKPCYKMHFTYQSLFKTSFSKNYRIGTNCKSFITRQHATSSMPVWHWVLSPENHIKKLSRFAMLHGSESSLVSGPIPATVLNGICFHLVTGYDGGNR